MNYPVTFDNPGYYTNAGALGFSVVVFSVLAIVCISFLVGRRFVVGGELGGSKFGRNASCAFLTTLWLIYVTLSTLQAYGMFGDVSAMFGINTSMVHREARCWKKDQIPLLKERQEVMQPDGKMKSYAEGELFTEKMNISSCITAFIKAYATDKTAKPGDGCG